MKKSGFSLLELSIVLVIIGLIAGGIVAGASMIRAAELRAITTEFTQYQTAVNTFRDKYLGLPGDMTNATAFWGEAHSTPATCYSTASTGTETCNGNGNGNIDWPAGSHEIFRFWQHLANAELINGTFSGITTSGGPNHATFGENTPESKLSGAGWSIVYVATYSGDTYYFDGSYNNTMLFGSQHPANTANSVFTAEEAWNIDTKLDDGKPGQGKIIGLTYTNCTNAANSADITTNYDLTNKDIDCILAFRNVF